MNKKNKTKDQFPWLISTKHLQTNSINNLKDYILWVGLVTGMQGWFNRCKSVNIMQHMMDLKTKIIQSFQQMQKMVFNKVKHSFITEVLRKLRIEVIYLNILHTKPIANMILSGGNSISSKIWNKKGRLQFPLLLDVLFKILALCRHKSTFSRLSAKFLRTDEHFKQSSKIQNQYIKTSSFSIYQ